MNLYAYSIICCGTQCCAIVRLNLIRYGGWTGSFVSACPLCFKRVDAVSAQIIQPLCEPAIAHVSCFCQPLNWVIKLIYIIMYQGSADSVGSLVLCVLVIIIFLKQFCEKDHNSFSACYRICCHGRSDRDEILISHIIDDFSHNTFKVSYDCSLPWICKLFFAIVCVRICTWVRFGLEHHKTEGDSLTL